MTRAFNGKKTIALRRTYQSRVDMRSAFSTISESRRLLFGLGFLQFDLTGIRKANGLLRHGAACNGHFARIDASHAGSKVGFDHAALAWANGSQDAFADLCRSAAQRHGDDFGSDVVEQQNAAALRHKCQIVEQEDFRPHLAC